jgi:plastocyanin
MRVGARRGISPSGAAAIVFILGMGAIAVVYVTSTQSSSDQLWSQGQQLTTFRSELQQLASEVISGGGSTPGLALPVINQVPGIRTVTETWYLSPSAHQDRFDPAFIVVNQGDTVRMTLIDNDTVAHDFVIGNPYDIIVNATVPGLINDLTGVTFITNATHNSPGVVVQGTPGNVTAAYSFVAKFSGIYEFVCTYHAQVGMIGYLVVLPNEAYSRTGTTTETSVSEAGSPVQVSIVNGAGVPPNVGFSPDNVTVVIGVNNTVVWTNNDASVHTVTANDASFDSGYLNSGETFSHTFTKPGVYEYHCTIHPWMIGFITVKSA